MNSNYVNFDQTRVLFWNARSLRARRTELLKKYTSYDIIIIVESWLADGEAINFPGYIVYSKYRADGNGGGIVFIVRNNIAFTEIKIFDLPGKSFELACLCFTDFSPHDNIYACYRPPGRVGQQDCDATFNKFRGENAILLGDFNAHNIVWGSNHTDSCGGFIEACVEAHGFVLLGDSTPTYVDINSGYRSKLDLAFATADVAGVVDISVSDESWGSDHLPVFVDIDLRRSHYNRKTFKIKTIRTNWTGFTNELDGRY